MIQNTENSFVGLRLVWNFTRSNQFISCETRFEILRLEASSTVYFVFSFPPIWLAHKATIAPVGISYPLDVMFRGRIFDPFIWPKYFYLDICICSPATWCYFLGGPDIANKQVISGGKNSNNEGKNILTRKTGLKKRPQLSKSEITSNSENHKSNYTCKYILIWKFTFVQNSKIKSRTTTYISERFRSFL